METKGQWINRQLNNEFYVKCAVLFAGILYWIYKLMPIMDSLFDLISIIGVVYIAKIILFEKNRPFVFSLWVAVVVSGLLTFIITKTDYQNLIALGYILIATVLLTFCSHTKTKEELQRELDWIAKAFVLFGAVILLICLATYYLGLNEVYFHEDITATTLHLGTDDTTGAMIGIMSNANITSDFCVMYLGLAAYLRLRDKKKLGFWFWPLMLIGIFALYRTYSRGGIIGGLIIFVMTVFLFMVKNARSNKQAAFLFAAMLLVLMLLVMLLFVNLGPVLEHLGVLNITGRDTAQMQRSTDSRIGMWKIGLRIVKDNARYFLFGVGNNIRDTVARFAGASEGVSSAIYNNMHNVYMQTWVSFGTIGLVLLLITIGYWMMEPTRVLLHDLQEHKEFIAVLGLLAALLVINLVESDFYMKKPFEGTFFWIVLGYYHSILSKREDTGKQQDSHGN